ncbi:hypothetical protein [Streptomyces sp. NPDC057438]|uniref:hypothetical protein n=1 Tax=Streptomyces sp. NPDC057438 TaxID=3346133 RepID=UPI0036BE155A
MNTSLTLDSLIRTRLAEITEGLWNDHRVLRVESSDARFLQIGSAATIERWQCQANHGSGLCGEPLVSSTEAGLLLGSPDYPAVESPVYGLIEYRELDTNFGFMAGELVHFSDVVAEFEAQG